MKHLGDITKIDGHKVPLVDIVTGGSPCQDFCLICGKPTVEHHHIFKGVKQRKLSDEDGLIIPLCKEHHTGNMSVHQTKELNILVEIIGQLQYEKHYIAQKRELPFEGIEEEAREAFRSRYGRSYM